MRDETGSLNSKITKYAKENKIDKNLAVGALLLYTVISSAITLINKIVNIFFTKNGLLYFFEMDLTWLIVAVVSIVVMSIYIKKNNLKYRDLFINQTLIYIVGLLLILEGIFSLSNSVTIDIISTKSALLSLKSMGTADNTPKLIVIKMILTYIVSIIITLSQIIVGFIILSVNKKNNL